MSRRRLVEDLGAAACILAVMVVAFANVLFSGKALAITDNANPLDFRYTERNYGPGFVPAEAWLRRGLVTSPNYRDPAAQTLQGDPAAELLRRSLARGQFPFWDPYTGGGTPVFASLVPAYLFPPALLVVLLGNGSGIRNAYLLLLISLSGILTYRLLRGRGLSWPAALTGGLAFAFSGAVIQTAPLTLGQPVAFLSLPLLATARLCERPSRRRAAELAAAAAFVALASFPPIVVQALGVCVIYLLATVASRQPVNRAAVAGWFAGGAMTALAVVSITYVPALFAFSESTQVARSYADAAMGTLSHRQVFQLLSPTIFGGAGVYARPPLPPPGAGQYLYYTGVVPLLLALTGMFSRADPRARVLKIAVLMAGGLALAKLFGWPVVQWIAYVPLLRSVHYASYFGIVVAYAICVLAAFGVDAIGTERLRSATLLSSGAAIAVLLTVLRVYAGEKHVELHADGWRWIADFRLLVLFASLATACALLAIRRPQARVFALAALLVVLGIEGVTNAAYPRQRRWNVWDHPPRYIEVIAGLGTNGRVLPMPLYPANTPSAFGQSTLDSVTIVTSPRIVELYKRYFHARVGHFLEGTDRLPPERVLDAANVEFFPIMTDRGAALLEAQERGYGVAFEDALVRLMRRRTLPRYFFTSDYRVMTPSAALDALPQVPAGTVILEERPSFEPMSAPPVAVDVVRFDVNEVQLRVDAPRAGLVFCSEARMRGWTASLDGREVPIVAADYAFRAVEVPPGTHTIQLRYRPPGLTAGLVFSTAGLSVLLACLLVPQRQARLEPGP